jgi:hypothetical protein
MRPSLADATIGKTPNLEKYKDNSWFFIFLKWYTYNHD